MEGKRPTRSRGSQPLMPEPPKPPAALFLPQQKPQKKESQKGASFESQTMLGPSRSESAAYQSKKREEKDRFKAKLRQGKEVRLSSSRSPDKTLTVRKIQEFAKDDGGGIGSDVLQLQQQTHAMIKEQKQKKLQQEAEEVKKPPTILPSVEEEDQEKAKDDRKVLEKFESIIPHPRLATGRYVLIDNQVKRITKVDQNLRDYEINGEEEKSDQQTPLEKLSYISKIFLVKASNIENLSEQVSILLNKPNNSDNQLVVAQLLSEKGPRFACILHSEGTIKIEQITLKDSVNLSKDLKDYDSEAFKEIISTSYKAKYLSSIMENCKTLAEAYDSYFNQARQVYLTKDNLNSHLFTIISFESCDSEPKPLHRQKQAIFLRAKYDTSSRDYLIFVRLMNAKNTLKERTDWLSLSKYRISSDLTKGYVSIDYLSNLENVNNTQHKLNYKNFTLLNYWQSLVQKQKLRDITDIQDHSEKPRKAVILKNHNNERCSYCNYLTDNIEHLKCSSCAKVYHPQCLKSQEVHSCLGMREAEWQCQDCIRCTNCLSSKNRLQLLICQHCNSGYHYDCLSQIVKLSVPTINMSDSKIGQESKKATFQQLNEVYKCEQCVKCEHCGTVEAGDKRQNKWSKDFKLCSNCNKKRQRNQYCQVCEKFWPDTNYAQLNEENVTHLGKIDNNLELAQCGKCRIWVHLECDRMFESQDIRKKFLDDRQLRYNCQKCRQNSRTQLISQLIDQLIETDTNRYFQEPVEDQVLNYTKIIKVPMCFRYVRQKIQSYLRSPEQLRSDVNLIFQNAITFNLPKHKVHKAALKLKDLNNKIIGSIWNTLEQNKTRTLDEDTQTIKMKRLIEEEKNPKKLSQQSHHEDWQFTLKPEDLFEASEHNASYTRDSNFGSRNVYHVPIDDVEMNDSDFERQRDLKKLNYQQDLMESDDQAVSASDVHSQMGHQGSGIIKNLRVRKQINYNENQLQASSGLDASSLDPLNLSGSKRTFGKSLFDDLDANQGPSNTNTVRGLKRQRQGHNFYSTDPDFQPPSSSHPLKHAMSAANLLQQALQKQEQNDALKEETKPEASHAHHIQQQQQMMMNYYLEIDDEKCYYANPARCSYDDPALLFEEMCYLCGSFGNREDFLSCTLCGESFHTYCLQLPEDDVRKYQSYWKCLNCKFCEICSHATQEAFLLYCDECDKAFHSFCLKPMLKSIPNCQWKCQQCFQCQSCGTKEFFSLQDTEQKKNLEVTEFEFSQNFTFCYQCGINEYKKSFCKICQKKNEDSDTHLDSLSKKNRHASLHQQSLTLAKKLEKELKVQDLMLKCTTCGFYSHSRCSRLLPGMQEITEDAYKCLECLLTGKTINHLIRETCDTYENIHQIISRQKLLAAVCQEALGQYFPIEDKAPLFIKSFIDQNVEFFRTDPVITDWLSLLETQVCFEIPHPDSSDDSSSNLSKDDENDDAMEIVDEIKDDKPSVITQKRDQSEEKPKKEIEMKEWHDMTFKEVFEPFEPKQVKPEETEAQKAYQAMYGHKETFLPEKKNLYKSLKSPDNHRFAQRKLFISPSELAKMITTPSDEILRKLNFSELYTEIEFKAVMKLKLTFFRWFEDLIKSILKNNQKFLKKQSKKSLLNAEQSEDVIMQQQQQIETINMQSDDSLCTQEDTLVINPQMKLQCILCKLNGELTVTGRLIPYQVNQFVHVNCAMWSSEVYEIGDGQLINFFQVQSSKGKSSKCWVCGEQGATIQCFTKKCHAVFHFPCAYKNQKIAFLKTKETYCDQCCRYRDFKAGYFAEFTTKRRFQIAKNNVPFNMSSTFQSQSAPGGPLMGINILLYALQQTQQNLGNPSNHSELEKKLQIEKWRPFYYDMFNRVGNLTVLSLKKEINQIIEESLNAKKEINPEALSDFSAIRIYWKFYKDSQLTVEDDTQDLCQIKKTYYLYCNNQIRELVKNDLNTVLSFSSDRIKDKVKLGLQFNQQENALMIDQTEVMAPIISTQFWSKIMQHFQKERPNFSLHNIIFSISEFGGKTKYPISVWNRAEVKNKTFFLKSGSQVLNSQLQIKNDQELQQNTSQSKAIQGKTFDDVFRRMMKINQMGENQNPLASVKRYTSSKHMPYEKMLNCLGKKMFYSRQPEHDQQQAKEKSTALTKKIRLTDTIDATKEIDLPIAMKYRLSKTQPKRVEVGPSKIHRNGLFTLEDLATGDIVIEYVGEKIRNKVADKREIYYEQKGIGDCYLFRLDKEYIIDATFFGNKARYLNHSCDANCSAKIINVQSQKHIIISTNRAIKQGEELTYNYNFDFEADKLDCFCGAQGCTGRLN